jgi:DNA-binding transcriptional ArsR family regulator
LPAPFSSWKLLLDLFQKTHNHRVVDSLGITFTALSDPTRRAIINRLSRNPSSVHGLTGPFELSQQAISKHLAYLERAKIVKKAKVGRESICTLRPEAIKAVSDWTLHYRRFWEESFNKLDSVLKEMKGLEAKNDKKQS